MTSDLASRTATVLGLMQAHREGRLDDMVEHLHPDVRWRPMFRPGLALYEGRAGVRQLVADITATLGPYWFEVLDVVERADGLRVCTHLVLADDDAGTHRDRVEFNVTFRDGLMHEVAAYPAPAEVSPGWDDGDPSVLRTVTVPLGRVAIVVVEGVLADGGRDRLTEAVRGAVDAGHRLVQLECYGVTAAAPGLVPALRAAWELTEEAGVELEVLRPSPALRPALAGLDWLPTVD